MRRGKGACYVTTILTILGCMAVAPRYCAAQFPLQKLYQKLMDSDHEASPTDPMNDFGSESIIHGLQESIFNLGLMQKNACDSKDEECAANIIKPAPRNVPTAALLPKTTQSKVDILYDISDLAIIEEHISNPRYRQYVTLSLTEPAIFRAISAANQDADASLSNRLLTDMTTFDLAKRIPAADPFIEAYVECLQARMQKGYGYPQAQAFCRRDTFIESEHTGSLAMASSEGIFKYHPAYDAESKSADVKAGKIVYLTDLVFNPEQGAVEDHPMQKLKENFRAFYGDIKYEASAYAKESSSYSKIDPTAPVSFTMLQKLHEKFNYMRWVLQTYCEYFNESEEQPSVFSNFHSYAAKPKTIWVPIPIIPYYIVLNIPVVDESGYRRLSIPGFAWNPVLWEILFAEVRELPKSEGMLDCKVLNTVVGYPSLNKLPTPLQKYIEEVVKPEFAGTVPPLFRMMFFFARRLALGETLGEALMAVNVLHELSYASADAGKVSRIHTALELIYDRLGTRDIFAAMDDNIVDMREYALGAFARRQEEVQRARDTAR